MIIEFVKRTKNDEVPTIYKCVYWEKGEEGYEYFKGEILVDFEDGTTGTEEFINTSLALLKLSVYEFISDLCEYEYKVIEEFNIDVTEVNKKIKKDYIDKLHLELDNHEKNVWGRVWVKADSDLKVTGYAPDSSILHIGHMDKLNDFFDSYSDAVDIWVKQ